MPKTHAEHKRSPNGVPYSGGHGCMPDFLLRVKPVTSLRCDRPAFVITHVTHPGITCEPVVRHSSGASLWQANCLATEKSLPELGVFKMASLIWVLSPHHPQQGRPQILWTTQSNFLTRCPPDYALEPAITLSALQH